MIKIKDWTMDYVDSVLIVDKHYTIIHTLRFNPRFGENPNNNVYSNYLNRNFFEIYPNMKHSESSIKKCMETGKVVIKNKQKFMDMNGNVFNTTNLTIPIINKGEIVGAIELSKDITSIDDDIQVKQKNIKKKEALIQQNQRHQKITFNDIITCDKEMKNNIKKAKIYAKAESPTLIYGETGTGKEMFVEAMVEHSSRKNAKYIAQNCAAIPESLFESLLFGTIEGAYTGAKKSKGLFELAHEGTLFLDEINSMSLNLQAKLLRVLQDGVIRSVGSTSEKRINVKIIAAMNIDPMDAIKRKILREDLFYRFSSGTIRLVPLRERLEDISLYIQEFMSLYNKIYNKKIEGISKNLLKLFMNYEWKGNVRELKHIIESMVSISDEKILKVTHLPIYMKNILEDKNANKKMKSDNWDYSIWTSLNDTVRKMETEMIIKALTHTGGNLTKSGELLKIPRQTLKYKINLYQINLEMFK